MKDLELYFHKSLNKIENIKNINILYSGNDKIVGGFKYFDMEVNFIESSEKNRNIFVSIVRSSFDLPKSKRAEFIQSVRDLYTDIKEITGVHISYEIDKENNEVTFNYLTSIPYIKHGVINIEYIIEPLLNIMYSTYAKVWLFFFGNNIEQ